MKTRLLYFNIKGDERGSLVALEQYNEIPFELKRVCYIFGTKTDCSRGFHAHKKLEQILVCVSGSCDILVSNGRERKSIHLNKPNQGLYIGPMLWREMMNFTIDCVLLVFASEYYDEMDYIRDYKEFISMVSQNE